MNLPCSINWADGFSGLIFERMTDIEERFASNNDGGSLIERELLSRAGVKKESRTRTTENVNS
jgi:hypothetical protein